MITVLSVGLLAWVPFMHAAVRLRRRSMRVLTAVYGAAAVTVIVLITSPSPPEQPISDTSATRSMIGTLLMFVMIAAGCVQQALIRREVYAPAPAPVPPSAADMALANAVAARERRDAARKLATADPLIARELRIGRPDLNSSYDDGGLVDLNSAPATVIAHLCDLTMESANDIVAARTACGGLATVEDLFAMVEIPVGAWDRIRDRAIAIPG